MVFDFGYRLQNLRRSKHLTQTMVAKRLKLSKASISGYENNTKTPSVDVLVKLAMFYGVSTDYLLGLNSNQINLDGLTSGQKRLVTELINELRK